MVGPSSACTPLTAQVEVVEAGCCRGGGGWKAAGRRAGSDLSGVTFFANFRTWLAC